MPDTVVVEQPKVVLDADNIFVSEADNTVIAEGNVEAKYEGRVLRADRLVYFRDTDRVRAIGNVVVIDADGSESFANEIETSSNLIDGYAIGLSRRQPMSTIGYAITRAAADHLVRTQVPFFLPVDVMLKRWWAHGLCAKVVMPSVCQSRYASDVVSTLDQERDAAYTVGALTRFTRNIQFQLHMLKCRRAYAADFPKKRRFP